MEETTSETKVWSPRYQWEDNIKLDLKEMWYFLLYINIFRHLKNAVRRKRPENGESIVGFTFKTCSSTPVDFVRKFLIEEQ